MDEENEGVVEDYTADEMAAQKINRGGTYNIVDSSNNRCYFPFVVQTKDPVVVNLQCDITAPVGFAIAYAGSNVTINGNGHSITVGDEENDGTYLFLVATAKSDDGPATLTVNGGTYEFFDTVFKVGSGSTLVVNSGEFTSTSNSVISASDASDISLHGGTFTSFKRSTVNVGDASSEASATGTLTIDGNTQIICNSAYGSAVNAYHPYRVILDDDAVIAGNKGEGASGIYSEDAIELNGGTIKNCTIGVKCYNTSSIKLGGTDFIDNENDFRLAKSSDQLELTDAFDTSKTISLLLNLGDTEETRQITTAGASADAVNAFTTSTEGRFAYDENGKYVYFTTKASLPDPDPDAYAVTYDGAKLKSKVLFWNQVEELENKTLGGLPLDYAAKEGVDVTAYGKAKLHYYEATRNKNVISADPKVLYTIGAETDKDAELTPGAVYYVVVETEGTDDYNAARYDNGGLYIEVGKPEPAPEAYAVMLKADGSTDALWKESAVDYDDATWSIEASPTKGAGIVENVQYRDVNSTDDGAWTTEKPVVPGTYAVALQVAEGDTYASMKALTSDDWRITIRKGALDTDNLDQYVDYNRQTGKVTPKTDYKGKLGSIIAAYYEKNADGSYTVVSKDGTLPEKAGTYYVGFRMVGSKYYENYGSDGPVSDWTYTVLEEPDATLYTVTLDGEEITEAGPIPYGEPVQVKAEATGDAGAVIERTIEYIPVIDNELREDLAVSLSTPVPGTYQVRFKVEETDKYCSDYVTSEAWQFTVDKATADRIPEDALTYDPDTNEITSSDLTLPVKDITILYYKDGKIVTDLVNGVPRVGGTYQVGYQLTNNVCYQDYTSGPVDGWEYTVQPHFISLNDFTVTIGGEKYDPTAVDPMEIEYTGEPVKVELTPNEDILPVGDITIEYKDTEGNWSEEAPKDAGTYSYRISVAASKNNYAYSITQSFIITPNNDLEDAITVTAPTNVREGDEGGFELRIEFKDNTLTMDDLEITYIDEQGHESTEAPTKAGTYTYRITVKASDKNFAEGSSVSANYIIESTEPSISGGDLTTVDPGAKLIPGTKVKIEAPKDTDTNKFQQWVISVDGVEVDTVEGLKNLGIEVDETDPDAVLHALQNPNLQFKMPEGKLSIYSITTNPQQEAFDKAVGTTLIVGGAAAATGAVYYFGTTAYIRSQLPEGVAVPQNNKELAVALWEKAGKPATESTAVFADVPADSEELTAIRWAVESGLLTAKTAEDGTTFQPDRYVTRVETIVRLFQLQKQLNAQK